MPPRGQGEEPALRLFLSVDGKPEIEIEKPEFVLGSGPDTDLRLDLPLIAPRHARILWREGRHVFEDLHSARGSFQHGQPVDVRMIQTGDEIDLGGFLPVRFRLA
jgi:pSer/pThr/pTyr-binding forkhead associated (FHA) protein